MIAIPNHSRILSRQRKMVHESIDSGVHFSEVLRSYGWSYDDLVYESYELPESESRDRYYSLDDFRQPDHGVPVVSFFSGAGGLDLGLEAAGFSHLALVEHIELFCSTLRKNKPEWNVIGPPFHSGDVSKFDELGDQIATSIGERFEGLFVGGPPCQPFSIAANQRFSKKGENFKRVGFAHAKNGNLLFDYIELIKRFKPRAFLIENVPGLLEVDGGEQLQRAYSDLEAVGYHLEQPLVLIASEFKVPQNRTRLFIVGNRVGKKFKAPIGTGSQLSCQSVFQRQVNALDNHLTREHSAESIERYMKLDFGARDQFGSG